MISSKFLTGYKSNHSQNPNKIQKLIVSFISIIRKIIVKIKNMIALIKGKSYRLTAYINKFPTPLRPKVLSTNMEGIVNSWTIQQVF